jgi:hypothetical protein
MPDPAKSPDPLVLPATSAFSIRTFIMPEAAELGKAYPVPIPADPEPPDARTDPFAIVRLPQTDPAGEPRPGPPPIVTRLPPSIASSVTFDLSRQRTPPN